MSSRTKKAQSKTAHQHSESRLAGWLNRPMLVAASFAILTWLILWLGHSNYLRKIEDLNLFVCDRYFMLECINSPGGLLEYVGRWFTQLFYYPWLGALVYATMLGGMQLLALKAFRVPERLSGLTLVIPAMMLVSMLGLGYTIFNLKSPGYCYAQPLGLAVAMAIVWLFRVVNKPWVRTLILVAIPVVGYCPLGFYAMAATVLCLLVDVRSRGKLVWIDIPVAVLAGFAMPRICLAMTDMNIMKHSLYMAGFSRIGIGEVALWWPFAVAFVAVVTFAFMAPAWRAEVGRRAMNMSAIACGACVVVSVCFVQVDQNLRLCLAMERAAKKCEWQKMIDMTQNCRKDYNRPVAYMRDLALFRLGLEGDFMFKIPRGNKIYNAPRDGFYLRDLCSKLLYFNYGRANDSYHWTMEDFVEYGANVETLRWLAKNSIINGEKELARKYLRQLSRTMFHRQWAAKYLEYVDNPQLMELDPEMELPLSMREFVNYVSFDNGVLEKDLLLQLSAALPKTPEMLRGSLMASMLVKKSDLFWPRLNVYAKSNKRLPMHYQEAALLFSLRQNKVDIRRFNIDKLVSDRFEYFQRRAQPYISAIKNVREDTDAVRERVAEADKALREDFGDTYWFYYYFSI